MGLGTLTRMAWRNLWRNRRRSLLTLFSISFGVFLAVLFTSFQDRNWADMIDLAARLGGGHVTLQHAEYSEQPTLTRTVRSVAELGRSAQEDGHVTRVVSRIVGVTMLSTAGRSQGAGFIAFDPQNEDPQTLSILEAVAEGKLFQADERRGIVLGERLARNLGVSLGKKVVYTVTDRQGEIVSALARVSGILRTGSPSVDGGLALLPINTMREVLGYEPDEAVQVAVFISDQRRSATVAGALQRRVGDRAVALPWFEAQPELAAFIAMKVGGLRVMEVFIALLVAAGIFNTLFVSVTERLREFGIMLAIGFSPWDVFKLVMLESFWMGVSGLIGAALITAWPYYYLNSTGIDVSSMMGDSNVEIAGVGMSTVLRVEIFPASLALIAIAAVCATLLAGLLPAWRAGRVEPVETISLV